MVPFGLSSICMIIWGLRADRKGDHVVSTAIPLGLNAACVALTMFTNSVILATVLLTCVPIANYATKEPFWALSTSFLSSAPASARIAAINTIAHSGTG